ncbi:MAG: hypothetical protein JSW37_03730 [Anaerolineales bacterium]|nr:MAG: hypothetical protein JSW37_03730 [Anaerolineales bacterium]
MGMKCKKCGETAVINMRQHRLALCKDHFLEWVPQQVQRAIEKFGMFSPDDRVLVAVSGGKDSLGLWDILLRLGYSVEGLYIHLGIPDGDYSGVSQKKVEGFASERGAPFMVIKVAAEFGMSIPEVARSKRGRSTCGTCGLIKRHTMNQLACEGGYGAIATGHNVDDEAAVLFQNVLHWSTGYLARQAPVLPASHPKLARKVKPLIRLYEREMAAYALLRGIDYIYQECPHSKGATTLLYKELLNQLEERSPGAKQQFYLSFLQARQEGRLLPDQTRAIEMGECTRCGQPTTAPDLCAFCRLWEPAPIG